MKSVKLMACRIKIRLIDDHRSRIQQPHVLCLCIPRTYRYDNYYVMIKSEKDIRCSGTYTNNIQVRSQDVNIGEANGGKDI